ncbi:MAG: hypothetical protein V1645_01465 [archaeon]
MVEKRLLLSLVLLVIGALSTSFVCDWEMYDPHYPWWDMSGWWYYFILYFYKFFAAATTYVSGFIFGLVVIGQFCRFMRFSWKSIWS